MGRNFRQEENQGFIDLLSHARVGELGEKDIEMLESRRIKEEDSERVKNATHVFYTNEAVEDWNTKKLNELTTPLVKIVAKTSGLVNPTLTKAGMIETTQFMKVLQLKKGARVMLTHNINTSDGLVNGATGEVLGFEYHQDTDDKETTDPKAVIVKFYDPETGSQQREKFPGLCWKYTKENGTAIIRTTMNFNKQSKRGNTHAVELHVDQFALRLNFACTGHKLQGITIQKGTDLVCHGSKKVPGGLYYVMLSRLRVIENLFLDQNFDISKIHCNTKALREVRMLEQRCVVQSYKEIQIEIFYANIRSVVKHLEDLKKDLFAPKANFICLTETRLATDFSNEYLLEGYKLHHCSHTNGNGVAFFAKETVHYSDVICFANEHFQIISFVMHANIQIFVVYLKSNLTSVLKEEFLKKMTEMQKKDFNQLILGDFNFHYGEKSVISEQFHQQGLTQMIKDGSHVQGNIIDQIYVDETKFSEIKVSKTAWYYCDHLGFTIDFNV